MRKFKILKESSHHAFKPDTIVNEVLPRNHSVVDAESYVLCMAYPNLVFVEGLFNGTLLRQVLEIGTECVEIFQD